MSKTLNETIANLESVVATNATYARPVQELLDQLLRFKSEHPSLSNLIVLADSGYDPELGSSWNCLILEDEKENKSYTLVDFDENSPISAVSVECDEFSTNTNELVICYPNGSNKEVTLIEFM